MAKDQAPRVAQIHWPMAGYHARFAYSFSPPYSSAKVLNVRPESAAQNPTTDTPMRGRERGGSRPGLAKMFDQQLGGGGETTATIAYNASAATVQTALEGLAAIASGDVAVTGTGPWVVEFKGSYANEDVPSLTADGSSLTGGGTIDIELVDADFNFPQESGLVPYHWNYYTLTLSSAPTGGTYTVTLNGETTGNIGIASPVGSLEAGIDALPSTPSGGSNSIDLTGAGTITDPYVFHIYFRVYDGDPLSYQEDISTFTADGSNLTGNKATVTITTTQEASTTVNEKQTITLGEDVSGGTFTLSWGPSNPIQSLNTLTYISGNTVNSRLTAIAGGKLYLENPVGTMSIAATNGGSGLNPDVLLHTAERNQVLYIANYSYSSTESASTYVPKKYTPATDTFADWTASDGTIPKGCNCIAVFRDCAVLAGGTTTPHNIFLSRQGDFDDWDFAEDDDGAAVSLTLSDAGQIGDIITCVSPMADNCMTIGCVTSLWILRGHPRFGGEVNNLSRSIGVIDFGAYCVTPENLFVFLSQDGIYMTPAGCNVGQYPESVSPERIPQELKATDRAVYNVALAYDTVDRGVMIYLTPKTPGASPATHWWLDWESKSFWKVEHGDSAYEPFCLHARKNFYSLYSGVAMGCRDGYIRRHKSDVATDDGDNFDTEVWMGPFGDPTMMNDVQLNRLMARLAKGSGEVNWSVHAGETPEDAFAADAAASGVWRTGGSNHWEDPRVRGGAFYLKLQGTPGTAWGWEGGVAILKRGGLHRS